MNEFVKIPKNEFAILNSWQRNHQFAITSKFLSKVASCPPVALLLAEKFNKNKDVTGSANSFFSFC